MTDKAFEGPDEDLKEDMTYDAGVITDLPEVFRAQILPPSAEQVYAQLDEITSNPSPERVKLAQDRMREIAQKLGGGVIVPHIEVNGSFVEELKARGLKYSITVIDGKKHLTIAMEDIAESDMNRNY